MKALRWLKEKYHNILSDQSLTDFVKDGYIRLKNEIVVMISKSQHLHETNRELAFYHYNHKNMGDAALRFKMLYQFTKNPEYLYYLGRSYLEIGKLEKAKQKLKMYLESGDQKFKVEAQYCLYIAQRNFEAIRGIPLSIIKHIFTQYATVYSGELELTDVDVSPEFFSHSIRILQDYYGKKGIKVLDLGCSNGVFGVLIARCLNVSKLIGVELVPQLAQYAQNRFHNNSRVYDELLVGNVHDDNVSSSIKAFGRYDLIIADEWLSMYPDVQQFLNFLDDNLKQGGLCVLSFTQCRDCNTYKFCDYIEQFEFNLQYVTDMIQQRKYKLSYTTTMGYDEKLKSQLLVIEKL